MKRSYCLQKIATWIEREEVLRFFCFIVAVVEDGRRTLIVDKG